jgi:hypothetical protein
MGVVGREEEKGQIRRLGERLAGQVDYFVERFLRIGARGERGGAYERPRGGGGHDNTSEWKNE